MDILGLGVLITGESGIGKSECALDLIGRGHRLVADDTVEIRCRGEAILIGTCPELTRHHVEIRGLGLVNVTDLFGVSSTRSSKRVELVVQLERWEAGREYDRLGLETVTDGHPRRHGAARDDAGGARPQSRDAGRGRGAQSAAALARPPRRQAARRAARAPPGAARRSANATTARWRTCERKPGRHRGPERRGVGPRARRSSSSPASRAPASRTRFARSRISATSASTTCPIALIPTFADLTLTGQREVRQAAVVVDVREGRALSRFPAVYRRLKRRYGPARASALSGGVGRGDSAPLQRDAAAPSARRGSVGRRRHSRGAASARPIRRLADQVVDTSR